MKSQRRKYFHISVKNDAFSEDLISKRKLWFEVKGKYFLYEQMMSYVSSEHKNRGKWIKSLYLLQSVIFLDMSLDKLGGKG